MKRLCSILLSLTLLLGLIPLSVFTASAETTLPIDWFTQGETLTVRSAEELVAALNRDTPVVSIDIVQGFTLNDNATIRYDGDYLENYHDTVVTIAEGVEITVGNGGAMGSAWYTYEGDWETGSLPNGRFVNNGSLVIENGGLLDGDFDVNNGDIRVCAGGEAVCPNVNNGGILVEEDGAYATSQGTKSVNHGSIRIHRDGRMVSRFGSTIVNETDGTIELEGVFDCGCHEDACWFENKGTVTGRGEVDLYGDANDMDAMIVYMMAQLGQTARFENWEDISIYRVCSASDLEELMAALPGDRVVAGEPVEGDMDTVVDLTADIEIPAELTGSTMGKICVPPDVTLTVSGQLEAAIENDGVITVPAGGCLATTQGGYIRNHNRITVDEGGTFISQMGGALLNEWDGTFTLNGTFYCGCLHMDGSDNIWFLNGGTVAGTGEILLVDIDPAGRPVENREEVVSRVESMIAGGDPAPKVSMMELLAGTIGDVAWVLEPDGSLTLYGEGDTGDLYEEGSPSVVVTLPWGNDITSVFIQDGITRIGNGLFEYCDQLTSVTIPASVESIGCYAFLGCTGLTEVVLGNPDATIEFGAFMFCDGLCDKDGFLVVGNTLCSYNGADPEPVIPDGVTRISGAFAFNSYIYRIVIPDGVTEIGEASFLGCSNLRSVTLPDSVIRIGMNAFGACEKLNRINVTDGVTEIEDGAFFDCKKMADDNGLIIVRGTVHDYVGESDRVVVPDGVTRIPDAAFMDIKNLKAVTIPASVTEIGDEAFTCWDNETQGQVITPGLTLVVTEDSYAHRYAQEKNIPFRFPGVEGDLDGDKVVTDDDAIYLLLYTFFPEEYPIRNPEDYDFDGDGDITDDDAIWLLLYTFFPEEYPITVEPVADRAALRVDLGIESPILDPALSYDTGSASLLVHLFSGLARWEEDESGRFTVVPDAAEALVEGVVNQDGTVTYTYTLRDGLTWSDGKPVTAGDFVFAWKRAASEELDADYAYLFEVVDGYFEGELNVSAPDDKTLVVTLYNVVPYWEQVLAFPTLFPVREDVVSDPDWAEDAATFVGNGPYTIAVLEWRERIMLERNENHVDAARVTLPSIEFTLYDDYEDYYYSIEDILDDFREGKLDVYNPVVIDDYDAVYGEFADEFRFVNSLGTYYFTWNANFDVLPAGSGLTGAEAEQARAEIRKAIGLLIDRNYITEEICAGGQVPASSFVAKGVTDLDGTDFSADTGYYDASAAAYAANVADAVATLKKYYTFDETSGKFTDVPALTYLFNNSAVHGAIGESMSDDLAGVGITMGLQAQSWSEFGASTANGDYELARDGWLADYDDPICFLDLWTSESGNNVAQLGKGEHANVRAYSLDLTANGYDVKVENGTWAETYDVLIAAIKTCTDETTRYALMHLAEDMIMDTGCITPLYYYVSVYMISENVEDAYATPFGTFYFMFASVK